MKWRGTNNLLGSQIKCEAHRTAVFESSTVFSSCIVSPLFIKHLCFAVSAIPWCIRPWWDPAFIEWHLRVSPRRLCLCSRQRFHSAMAAILLNGFVAVHQLKPKLDFRWANKAFAFVINVRDSISSEHTLREMESGNSKVRCRLLFEMFSLDNNDPSPLPTGRGWCIASPCRMDG